ncbi:MAG: class I SAM-dependent methyltransferase [Candidatus Aenigmatarchaeota archaeon]
MSKFQRIYWIKKFDWKHYSRLYNKYCKLKNNYYSLSSSKLVRCVKLTKDAKIVDMACGTGVMTSQLLKKYPKFSIFAIDLSKEMLAYYQKNFRDQIKKGQIKAVHGNAEQINRYTSEKYDVVFIASAFWDLEIEIMLKNVSKILNKNGIFAFNLPALITGNERGFMFFIEHFFRKALNSKMIYRRISEERLKKLFRKYKFQSVLSKKYSFRVSKPNVAQFFDLLRYRYPFIFFPKEIPYNKKLKRCTEIFNESLKYIPKDGINEVGFVFVIKKK